MMRAISQAGILALSEGAGVSGSTTVVASGVGLDTGVEVDVGWRAEVAAGEGEGVGDCAGMEVGAGVDTGVDGGVGTGVGVAVGIGVCMGVGVAVGVGIGVGVGVAVGVVADSGVGVGVGSGVGSGVGAGVGSGGGGLTTVILTMKVMIKPPASAAVTSKDAVPSSFGVMDRMPSSTAAEATSDSSSKSMT